MQCIPTCSPGSTPLRGLSSGVEIAEDFSANQESNFKFKMAAPMRGKVGHLEKPPTSLDKGPGIDITDFHGDTILKTRDPCHTGMTYLIKFSLTLIRYE